MICSRQGLRKDKHKDKHKDKYKDKYTHKYKDKYKNNQQTYDVICFWKGDDNRSLIMKNFVNMQSMQIMQNMQNISPLFFSSKVQQSHPRLV